MEKPPALELNVESQLPVATFRTSINQQYMLSFKEQLHKDFDLTPLQRQSQEWRSKCCGLNLISLANGVKKAVKADEARRARNQVARELAEVEAARQK